MNLKEKKGLQSLLNLASRKLDKNYGVSGVEFDILDESSGRNLYEKEFIIKMNKNIPFTVRNYAESEWNDNRYLPGSLALRKTLVESLKDFGFKLSDFSIESPLRHYDTNALYSDPMETIYKNYNIIKDVNTWKKYSFNQLGDRIPNRHFIITDGNDTAISKETGITYSIFVNWKIDEHSPWHLTDIENSDWWDALTDEDKEEIENTFG